MVVNGACESDWPQVLALARANPLVLPSFGYHPWYLPERTVDWQKNLEKFLDETPGAVGEIGLDCDSAGHPGTLQIGGVKHGGGKFGGTDVMLQQAQISVTVFFRDGDFAHVRFIEIGADQVGAAKRDDPQIGAAHERARHVGAAQIRALAVKMLLSFNVNCTSTKPSQASSK